MVHLQGPRVKGDGVHLFHFPSGAYPVQKKRPSGMGCPQRAAIPLPSQSRHPCPPVLPQGNPDQPGYKLSRRYEMCQGDSRSLNGGWRVAGSSPDEEDRPVCAEISR